MRKKLQFPYWKMLMAILLFFAFTGVCASGNTLYSVTGDSLRWVLDGFPGDFRPVELLEFRVERNSEGTESFDFSLSDLVNEDGHKFPRDLIVVQTPYDSARKSLNSVYSKELLLAPGDDYADIKIGLHYRDEVWAGTYTGYLHSGQGDKIPVEIVVNRYTAVNVAPSLITMDIPQPGTWEAPERVVVTVGANHGDWVVRLSSKGLFYVDDKKNVIGSSLAEPQVGQLELMVVVGEETFVLSEIPIDFGTTYRSDGLFSFKIKTETDLGHKAGTYRGIVQVDVQAK